MTCVCVVLVNLINNHRSEKCPGEYSGFFVLWANTLHGGYVFYIYITLWFFNIAMENGPFIDGLPIKNGDFPWLC